MLTDILWADESQFSIDKVEMENETIVMLVTATNEKGICPHCQKESESIHSHYQRYPVDLPLAGYAVRLDITVPRFFCDNEGCGATYLCREYVSFNRAIRPSHKTAGRPTATSGFRVKWGSWCMSVFHHGNVSQS